MNYIITLLGSMDPGTAEAMLGVMGTIALLLAAAWGKSVLAKLDNIADAVHSLGTKVERHDVEISNLKDRFHGHVTEETPQ